MTFPVLYTFRRCPYAMRTRLALWSAGIECELREVVLRDKPISMLNYSPKGSVPVLVLDDGKVIDESLDVMIWALDHNDPNHWLSPSFASIAQMRALIEVNDSEFKEHLDRYKYANRYVDVDPLYHRQAAERFIADLNTRLAVHQYLFGNDPCLADFAIMPFIRQFANTDRAWFDATDYPSLQSWLAGLLSSQLFASVMMKYPKWREGDQRTIVP
ncbi:MAG: glutathione S-transferase [Gammaproteobacteria bacterium]|jgi:glutathione S-transferase